MINPKHLKVLLPSNQKFIASFDVDAQKTFTPLCPQELPVPKGNEISSALNKQASYAQYRIGSKDAHPANPLWLADNENPTGTPITAPQMDQYWPAHAHIGSRGFELLDELPHPSEYDFFVYKGIERDMHPYGACFHDLKEKQSTGVIEWLKQKEVTTVIIGGLALDYCVKITALQLQRAQFNVIINQAACRGLNKESTQIALEEMRTQGVKIYS